MHTLNQGDLFASQCIYTFLSRYERTPFIINANLFRQEGTTPDVGRRESVFFSHVDLTLFF